MPILFLTAAAGGWIATGLARAAAVRWRLVTPPNPVIPGRQAPVPYVGGLGILAGAMAALLVHAWRSGGGWTVPWGLAVGCAGFALVGLIDDWSALAPGLKFLAQLAAASAAVWAGIPGGPPIHAGAFPDALFRVLWIVTVVNAVNFIDVCDALAATVALVTCFLWGVVPGCSSFPEAMTAAGGGCAGFLFWNRPPARIYMGDCGSHWLGFVMAAAALATPVAPRPWHWLVLLPMWTAVPVFELLFISSVRLHKGLPWWKGSPDHFALRLQKAGMSKAGIAVLSAFFTAAGWFGARCAATAGVWVRACLISAALATGCVCWKMLLPWDVVPEVEEDRL